MQNALKQPLPQNTLIQFLSDFCSRFINQTITVNAYFSLDNITYNVLDPSSVGTILEERFFHTLKNQFPTLTNGPPQQSPDYFLTDPTNHSIECEMKCFKGTPGFDISSYDCYINQLIQPSGVYRKLFNTKYLIFQYEIERDVICIKNFFFKNVWDLINYDGKYPISVNNKKQIWHNIRPSTVINSWTDPNKTPQLFIDKIIQSIRECPHYIENREVKIANIQSQFDSIKQNYYI